MNLSIRTRNSMGFTLLSVLFVGFSMWLSGQLSDVKSNVTLMSEEIVQYADLATSEELSGQAEPLQQSIAFFTTGDDTTPTKSQSSQIRGNFSPINT